MGLDRFRIDGVEPGWTAGSEVSGYLCQGGWDACRACLSSGESPLPVLKVVNAR